MDPTMNSEPNREEATSTPPKSKNLDYPGSTSIQYRHHSYRWLVKVSFVVADGARASALNVYTHVDADTIRWQSTNREIAGELQPNIPEVTVVRQKSPEREKEESQ